MQYTSVILGGTFDGLHRGHQTIIRKAFEIADHVTIGLTTDEYVAKFKYQRVHFQNTERNIRSYRERETDLLKFLEKEHSVHRVAIVPLSDPFGTLIPGNAPEEESSSYDALVVSSETRKTADHINLLRVRGGWKELPVVEVPLQLADDGTPIASERVRNGEIDIEGHLVMPDDLRKELEKPLGILLRRDSELKEHVRICFDKIIITVGDVATKKLMDMGVMPAVAIIDLCVGRKPFQSIEAYKFPPDVSMVRVTSGPGYISSDALVILQSWSIDHLRTTVIIVEGEEDLLVLPMVKYAPIGSIVYYGQPNVGMVAIAITPEKQLEAEGYMKQFIK